ncbi:MAG: hypothetical protein ABFR33_07780, partial [Verrucomicrobiota bacterium]
MRKFERISRTIAGQIEKGDFSLSGLPSGRFFADRLGVNRNTIGKAMEVLENEGVIQRQENGRYEITPKPNGRTQSLSIAFLSPPAYSSGNIRVWYEALLLYAAKHNYLLRPFLYLHWDDVSISQILSTFDGVFVVSSEEDIPPDTLKLLQSKNGLVMINNNISQYHILSVNLFPGVFVRHALDRLAKLAHKSIACLHIETDQSNILRDRIDQWK